MPARSATGLLDCRDLHRHRHGRAAYVAKFLQAVLKLDGLAVFQAFAAFDVDFP